jgi:vancomycin resistance protein YoaR
MLRSWLKLSPAAKADGTLDLAVQVDDAKIRPLLQDLAKQLDRPMQNAALDWDTAAKQVVVLKPSQTGQALDVKGATDAISKTLMSLAASPLRSPAAPADPVLIALPVKVISPTVDSSRIADLGIKELVTQGTTYFAGSAAERVHNIVNAAEKFRGALIPPGQEFSFNKIVGDVSAENGFVDSLIIRGDRTELGVGGGVCQVSTTAFRAAVQGGFPIIERHTHSYVVSWYGEPGLDATIYTPNVDFRFKNDTGAFLLVKPEVDAAKGRVTFSFYGTRPDRTVELSKPEISNIQKPEPPIYQEDSSLPRGTIKQVDWAKTGQDVVVKRTIRTGDGKVVEQKIASKYEPWRSVFLYGPGTKLPTDAVIGSPVPPSPTPTPTPKATR